MDEINSIYAIKVTQGLTATYVVISEDKTVLCYTSVCYLILKFCF